MFINRKLSILQKKNAFMKAAFLIVRQKHVLSTNCILGTRTSFETYKTNTLQGFMA